MAYPLIIFGAGASHDYSRFGKMSPLTNELAKKEYIHFDLLEKCRVARNLMSDIVGQVVDKGRGFEEVLTEIKNKNVNSKETASQFIALEFYLKKLFKRISDPSTPLSLLKGVDPSSRRLMHQINNYRIILDRISRYDSCVVTFNYDTLFEDSLDENAPQKMSDYISGNIKIIKMHGSHNWSYVKRKLTIDYKREGLEDGDDFGWLMKNPEYFRTAIENEQIVDRVEGTRPYHESEIQEKEKTDKNKYAQFPAIAVPIVGKDRHICPKSHIQTLISILPKVDRILIIGWKADDTLLLEILKRHLQEMGYKVLVVSSSLDSAKSIASKISKSIGAYDGAISAWSGNGFSDFTSDKIKDTFFDG